MIVLGLLGGALAPAAQAQETDILGIDVKIKVNTTDWSACGYVGDTLTGAYYTATLTATGYESTIAANGIILDADTDSGNPATPCTSGGFDSRYAVMVYTLTWTSVFGTTGTLVRTCVEANGIPACTISGF